MAITVKVEGMEKLLKKLEGPPGVISSPWKKAMTEAGKMAAEALRKRAPTQRGDLAKGIRHSINRKPVPTYARVTMRWRESASKARYPWILNAGQRRWTKSRPYFALHYSRGGGPTKSWITGTPELIKAPIATILSTAASDIKREWGR